MHWLGTVASVVALPFLVSERRRQRTAKKPKSPCNAVDICAPVSCRGTVLRGFPIHKTVHSMQHGRRCVGRRGSLARLRGEAKSSPSRKAGAVMGHIRHQHGGAKPTNSHGNHSVMTRLEKKKTPLYQPTTSNRQSRRYSRPGRPKLARARGRAPRRIWFRPKREAEAWEGRTQMQRACGVMGGRRILSQKPTRGPRVDASATTITHTCKKYAHARGNASPVQGNQAHGALTGTGV